MKTKKIVIILVAIILFISIVITIIYRYFPINILLGSFPKEDSYSLTIVCDSNKIYHVNDTITIKAVLENSNNHTFVVSHTGKIIHFLFQVEDEYKEINYPAIYVSETMWSNKDIVNQQTFKPEKAGVYCLTVSSSFTIFHRDQKKNYNYEKKIKIIVE